ncbi:efflux RND transporter periplasmic adaptor subunit [Hymenobacter volaticus]|uniref:efflux RND transporter periplasmic adaptor subunit n=1 Tax=Hymenobacter volaticus TaxID=2932254 RepID=UPI0028809478|nr:efflux RND transporter periplasmic adaptor subunit [Hymenobacter volaticus]
MPYHISTCLLVDELASFRRLSPHLPLHPLPSSGSLFTDETIFSFSRQRAAGGLRGAASPATNTGPPALPVQILHTSTETTYQDYPASIEGVVNVEIRPQVAGVLDRILVDEGAAVRKGQPLFKINDAPYRERLNNALAAQQAAVGAVTSAQVEVDRFAPLVQNKVVSEVQLQTAQAALVIAKANLQRAKAEVSSARINLGYTTISAPVSGFLGRLQTKQGSLVGPTDAQALTQLSDVHEVHTYFSLGKTTLSPSASSTPAGRCKTSLRTCRRWPWCWPTKALTPRAAKWTWSTGSSTKRRGP